MNIICDSGKIVDYVRAKGKLKEIALAGFSSVSFNCAALCSPFEFEQLRRKNFKKEQDFYLTKEPERLKEVADAIFFRNAWSLGLSVQIAVAPYAAPEVQTVDIDNEGLKSLAVEALKVAIDNGCHSIVVHPITAGIEEEDLWALNKAFYTGLGILAEELKSDVNILIINECKNINGHLIRGFLAEPEEACRFVDELNNTTIAHTDTYEQETAPRFGCCFDLGTATLCGQNVYEAILPLKHRLMAVIIRDCDGVHDVSMLPFTSFIKGQLSDWLGFIRGLRQLDFDGDLILDVGDTYSSFPGLLKPEVLRIARKMGDYFAWQIGMERMVKKYEKRVLFGAGNMCRAYMKDYGREYPPLFTCDNNSARWGEEFCGLTIESPEKLKELSPDVAIFLCNIYYDEIEGQLRQMGLKNPIERFNDEYMQTFYMDRLKMAKDLVTSDGGKMS